jgi:hypothetical protein
MKVFLRFCVPAVFSCVAWLACAGVADASPSTCTYDATQEDVDGRTRPWARLARRRAPRVGIGVLGVVGRQP